MKPHDIHELIKLSNPEITTFRKQEKSTYFPLNDKDGIILNNCYILNDRIRGRFLLFLLPLRGGYAAVAIRYPAMTSRNSIRSPIT